MAYMILKLPPQKRTLCICVNVHGWLCIVYFRVILLQLKATVYPAIIQALIVRCLTLYWSQHSVEYCPRTFNWFGLTGPSGFYCFGLITLIAAGCRTWTNKKLCTSFNIYWITLTLSKHLKYNIQMLSTTFRCVILIVIVVMAIWILKTFKIQFTILFSFRNNQNKTRSPANEICGILQAFKKMQ